jgi:hypothetical protein
MIAWLAGVGVGGGVTVGTGDGVVVGGLACVDVASAARGLGDAVSAPGWQALSSKRLASARHAESITTVVLVELCPNMIILAFSLGPSGSL